MVRVLFDLARWHAPSTVFFDEIDSIMAQRGGQGGTGNEHEGSRRMKTEVLIQMDGLSNKNSSDMVLVLAASNLPWELDVALLRRLEKRVLVPLPDQEARRQMVSSFLAGRIGEDCQLDRLRVRNGGLLGLGFETRVQGGGHAARATASISARGDGKFAGRRGRARRGGSKIDGREPRDARRYDAGIEGHEAVGEAVRGQVPDAGGELRVVVSVFVVGCFGAARRASMAYRACLFAWPASAVYPRRRARATVFGRALSIRTRPRARPGGTMNAREPC